MQMSPCRAVLLLSFLYLLFNQAFNLLTDHHLAFLPNCHLWTVIISPQSSQPGIRLMSLDISLDQKSSSSSMIGGQDSTQGHAAAAGQHMCWGPSEQISNFLACVSIGSSRRGASSIQSPNGPARKIVFPLHSRSKMG